MAKYVRKGRNVGVKFETPDLRYLRDRLKPFGKKIAAKHFAAALRKALRPGYKALKSRTPSGPTGNLKASIRIKTKSYRRTGAAWGAVGYTYGGQAEGSLRGGTVKIAKDRGFHAHLVEFGTKDRTVRRSARNPHLIASSFKRLTPFKLRSQGSRVQTSPGYPMAFFKKGRQGLRSVSTGRVFGQGMMRRAFAASKGQMERRLREIINDTITKAWQDLNKQ